MSDKKKLNEENVDSVEKYPFLKETFKDEEITGKHVWRKVLRMVGLGLISGIAACMAFYALKPLADTWFNGESEEVTIPVDDPNEDLHMLEGSEEDELMVENYRDMNKALYEVVNKSRACVAEVRVNEDSNDWMAEEKDVVKVSGVIIWDGGGEILILAPFGELPDSKSYLVKFTDKKEYLAVCKWKDMNLKFGIYTVSKSNISKDTLNKIKVVEWGNSYALAKGDPVISLGMQFGYSDGVGYGVISSKDNKVTIADYQQTILTTDIAAASGSSGILFNVEGKVVGIVDQKSTDTVNANLVSAYAISELKSAIELLSNGKGVPYLGILGLEVPQEVSEEEGIPLGLYVKEVELESPAMQAGIQAGDVVVALGDTEVKTQREYSNALLKCPVGSKVKVHIKRQGAETFEDITFDVFVGQK